MKYNGNGIKIATRQKPTMKNERENEKRKG